MVWRLVLSCDVWGWVDNLALVTTLNTGNFASAIATSASMA
jgi:hypothetical protein